MPPLSKRQVEELTASFHRFDLDNDGNITKAELVSVLNKLGSPASEREVELMMREADVDSSGGVDLQEFLQINAAALRIDKVSEARMLKEVFEVFDKDKNGVISPEELRDALMFLVPGGEEVTVDECRQMIQRVDSNGDGVVDFPEFQQMMMAPEPLPCS